MKPLVFWCRWHDATLRLHGRDEAAVWGELIFPQETEFFRFEFQGRLLTLGRGDESRRIQLDEMGVEVSQ